MRASDVVRPIQHVVIGAVIQRQNEVLRFTHRQIPIRVAQIPLFVKAVDLIRQLVERVVERRCIVVITANERKRHFPEQTADVVVSQTPFRHIRLMLGDVTHPQHRFHIFGLVVCQDPIVDLFKVFGRFVAQHLRITHHAERVSRIGRCRYGIEPMFPVCRRARCQRQHQYHDRHQSQDPFHFDFLSFNASFTRSSDRDITYSYPPGACGTIHASDRQKRAVLQQFPEKGTAWNRS